MLKILMPKIKRNNAIIGDTLGIIGDPGGPAGLR